MALPTALSFVAGFARSTRAAVALYLAMRACAVVLFGATATLFYRGSRQDVYNILWAVVFGFATLNIISLAARRLEPTRRRMSFGEMMAVMVVVVSILLLGWEMLGALHIFPIQLRH
jgi:membrane protein insertase Oxa1/YidC/SpoIIIJ